MCHCVCSRCWYTHTFKYPRTKKSHVGKSAKRGGQLMSLRREIACPEDSRQQQHAIGAGTRSQALHNNDWINCFSSPSTFSKMYGAHTPTLEMVHHTFSFGLRSGRWWGSRRFPLYQSRQSCILTAPERWNFPYLAEETNFGRNVPQDVFT